MSDTSSSSLHQEQLRARQRLLSASTGEDPTGSMVKMIAERVYFHMRSEFHDLEEKQILTRIKVRNFSILFVFLCDCLFPNRTVTFTVYLSTEVTFVVHRRYVESSSTRILSKFKKYSSC